MKLVPDPEGTSGGSVGRTSDGSRRDLSGSERLDEEGVLRSDTKKDIKGEV